jgi:hypothetical protein
MLFAVTAHPGQRRLDEVRSFAALVVVIQLVVVFAHSLTAFAPVLLLMAFLSTVVVCVCSAALNGPLPFDEGAFARATGPIVFL